MANFLSQPEIEHIKSTVKTPNQGPTVPQLSYHEGAQGTDGSSDTYWPVHSDLDAPGLDLGWPMQQHSFVGPTEVTTLVNPSEPNMPSIKEQARRLIKNAQQVGGRNRRYSCTGFCCVQGFKQHFNRLRETDT